MKLKEEVFNEVVTRETVIVLLERKLGRDLTPEEIERLDELFGIRSLSDKAATQAWEKELEKIKAGETEEEREGADTRQTEYEKERLSQIRARAKEVMKADVRRKIKAKEEAEAERSAAKEREAEMVAGLTPSGLGAGERLAAKEREAEAEPEAEPVEEPEGPPKFTSEKDMDDAAAVGDPGPGLDLLRVNYRDLSLMNTRILTIVADWLDEVPIEYRPGTQMWLMKTTPDPTITDFKKQFDPRASTGGYILTIPNTRTGSYKAMLVKPISAFQRERRKKMGAETISAKDVEYFSISSPRELHGLVAGKLRKYSETPERTRLKEMIKEELIKILKEESGYLGNGYKWCPSGTKCPPQVNKTKWWK